MVLQSAINPEYSSWVDEILATYDLPARIKTKILLYSRKSNNPPTSFEDIYTRISDLVDKLSAEYYNPLSLNAEHNGVSLMEVVSNPENSDYVQSSNCMDLYTAINCLSHELTPFQLEVLRQLQKRTPTQDLLFNFGEETLLSRKDSIKRSLDTLITHFYRNGVFALPRRHLDIVEISFDPLHITYGKNRHRANNSRRDYLPMPSRQELDMLDLSCRNEIVGAFEIYAGNPHLAAKNIPYSVDTIVSAWRREGFKISK